MKIDRTDALIVTDVQNDFCSGGALAVSGGDQVVPLINQMIKRFSVVIYTRDWHPVDHCSFSNTPTYEDKSWPPHCVQDTPGAAFHPDLLMTGKPWIVSKASQPDKEAYSSFQDTGLADSLRRKGVRRVFLCGLATDFCVKATALDALDEGFEVFVVEDACRGVDLPPGSAAAALDMMKKTGVLICHPEELA